MTKKKAKKAKTGPKPKVFKIENIKLIKNLAGVGCTNEMIANILSIPYGTFRQDMERNPEIQAAIKNGRDEKLGEVMATAFNVAIEGKNAAMLMFLLKTRAGWRETETIVVDEEPVDFEKLRKIV